MSAYRPLAFDRSLHEFHRDVNRIAGVMKDAAFALDHTRSLHSLDRLSAQIQAMLTAR